MPTVVSIQVGQIKPLGDAGVPSGFVKSALPGSARAETLGIDGDQQADLTVHGGPDKAVYFYPSEHYPRWTQDVPRHASLLVPGGFGENVTTTGLDENGVAIGDVLAIGSAEMQVTQPRQPCFKLGLRFDDNTLGRIMMRTGRTGWYVRVLHPGEFKAGDDIRVIRRPNPDWTIARFNKFTFRRSSSPTEAVELLKVDGLAESWKQTLRAAATEGQ